MLKLHLDTDIGGDIDDLCALAMLLNWPGVDDRHHRQPQPRRSAPAARYAVVPPSQLLY